MDSNQTIEALFTIQENSQPTISLVGSSTINLEVGDSFTDSGAWINFPYVQIYNLELDNSSAFKSAHDKFVKQTSKTRGNRPVAFGTYDIGGGNNSHWVAIGAKDFSDLISQKVINEAYKKEWAEWTKNNGGAVSSSNYSLRVLAAFTNE
jgi:hypothetical protein